MPHGLLLRAPSPHTSCSFRQELSHPACGGSAPRACVSGHRVPAAGASRSHLAHPAVRAGYPLLTGLCLGLTTTPGTLRAKPLSTLCASTCQGPRGHCHTNVLGLYLGSHVPHRQALRQQTPSQHWGFPSIRGTQVLVSEPVLGFCVVLQTLQSGGMNSGWIHSRV